MAWVDDNRQVGLFFDDRNCRDIQCVSGSGFEGADSALAEDNVFVSASHDVLSAHQQLFDCVSKTAFKKDWFIYFAKFLEKFEVLHISCTNLDDVNILKQWKMSSTHDLGNNRKSGSFFCLQKVLDAFCTQTLEGVWGGTWFECTTAH